MLNKTVRICRAGLHLSEIQILENLWTRKRQRVGLFQFPQSIYVHAIKIETFFAHSDFDVGLLNLSLLSQKRILLII